ncbi:unnamed protein product [Chondrus crispus]|uniref:Mitochondrial import inner membrane translocase subunit n=1 Tax=Chondrus crispus TaxID=2769 RepID=R7Q6C2_CHOCR|nr:unnamed protein product [Chondrus crispus]CDF32990.1 unnamed protein product [Chondrus crispus]|eukprot:XP_005712793.1 unnamed protein product [Chondrus crispus]
MARIEAQVNAQMSEVFREQVTDKCFVLCADVGKKQMSQREKDCVDRYVPNHPIDCGGANPTMRTDLPSRFIRWDTDVCIALLTL